MKMRRQLIFFSALIGIFIFLLQCNQSSRYNHMVKKGLESGERHDTIFLGLYLGMSSKDFYSHCWELNKQGLIRQGAGNTSVLYELSDELKATVDVNFYPTFFEDKIYEMPVTFRYKAWAPWNKQFSGDTLQLELRNIFQEWYGVGFIEIDHPLKGKAFLKVDGNRRISLYKGNNDDGIVSALYTDMSVDEMAKAKLKEKN
jgi:hypothetical protein